AATHAFNQHQRFVALPISTCGQQLIVRSPLDPSWAPPGDYMLFLVRTDSVPSVAKWVRLTSVDGRDDCDAVRPAAVTDLTVMNRGKTVVNLSWTDTGDDSLCGSAKQLDIRYARHTITASTWGTDSVAANVPTPGPSGTIHSCFTIAGLTPC